MDQLSDPLIFLGISAVTLVACYFLSRLQHSTLSYPPGPNPTSMPTYDPWVQYQSWGKEYGKLVYIRSSNTLIINNSRTAIDLLERRARVYSDRAANALTKLFASELLLVFKPYSSEWRRNRRQFQQSFRRATIGQFSPAQYSEVHKFLYNLTTSPENFMQHTMALSQRLVYAALYSLDISAEDPLMRKAVEVVARLTGYMTPGFYPWAERFPWLRFMPSWFPGCKFKQDIQQLRKDIKDIDAIPFNRALNNAVKSCLFHFSPSNFPMTFRRKA
jgi:cytochrome P450